MRGVTNFTNTSRALSKFQLTRLMRGVTSVLPSGCPAIKISTHTPHARRDVLHIIEMQLLVISTHTPHARRDAIMNQKGSVFDISTHTPHARRDQKSVSQKTLIRSFQLTRLMRGVTRIQILSAQR